MPDLADLFPGFASHWIDTGIGKIFARSAGAGPPLLLLHGYTETNVMWHRVAPDLAQRFTLVIPDLPGYGWSAVPEANKDHAPYDKRSMAKAMIEVTENLGHARFRMAGHDRGGRVAYRLALDHPGRVERMATLDIVPTYDMWHNMDSNMAMKVWHMSNGRPRPRRPRRLPPRARSSRPRRAHGDARHRADLRHVAQHGQQHGHEGVALAVPGAAGAAAGNADLEGAGRIPGMEIGELDQGEEFSAFDPRALDHYRASFSDPLRIHAQCEDYRAGHGADRLNDEADREAGKTIACPLLALWGGVGIANETSEPLAIWRKWAPQATGQAIDFRPFSCRGKSCRYCQGAG